nr:MAG TPA: hypothetical protein [Caudoviricetes sp.]
MNKYKPKTTYMHKYNRTNIGHSLYIYTNVRCIKSPQLPWTDKVLKTALALPFS